jgi:predicted nucleic acid-binding protein
MAEELIIDASVAAKWFFAEELSDKARRLLDDSVLKVAPELVLIELATPVWRRLRRGEIDRDVALRICAEFDDIFAELIPVRALAARASEIMIDLVHPVYDCLYLALAERRRKPLVTADRRLIEAAKRLDGVDVVHLADV